MRRSTVSVEHTRDSACRRRAGATMRQPGHDRERQGVGQVIVRRGGPPLHALHPIWKGLQAGPQPVRTERAQRDRGETEYAAENDDKAKGEKLANGNGKRGSKR